MSLSRFDSSTEVVVNLPTFVCPTTGHSFTDATALVQTIDGATIAQARCPHCSAAAYLDGQANDEEAWPQVHGFLIEGMV
jgi:hypothetical protein